MVNLDRCTESCSTLYDTLGRICVPNKTENVNLICKYDNRNKWIKNMNKAYIMQMLM